MSAPAKQGCAARVWRSYSYGSSGCSRPGTVERDGQWFCRQHDPVAADERHKARSAEDGALLRRSQANRVAGEALAAQLGAGAPHYQPGTGNNLGSYTEALVVPFWAVRELLDLRELHARQASKGDK